MYTIEARFLGSYDVAVCGGGIAGVCAAVTAARQGAKTVLIESGGCLGGTVTEGGMGNLLDANEKGGIIRELRDFLDAHNMTCPRRGQRKDANGRNIPGNLLNTEGVKYFFDKICAEAGVKVLLHSRVCTAEHNDGAIRSILLCTECGNYSLQAQVYVDATGNGTVADMVGCRWECGDPDTQRPNPVSMGASVTGMDPAYNGTDTVEEKNAYANRLAEHGIHVSAQQATVVKTPNDNIWGMGFAMTYGVMPDDIEALSQAVYTTRKEVFEVIAAHRQVPGFENIRLIGTNAHIGVREGRRIFGQYRLTDDDIINGRRFEDAVCLVTASVDVHKLHATDTVKANRGYRTKPYHIPYRCLVPLDAKNLLLAGRCISGDFYPFSSYRMIGNMAGVGEAAGYAAAVCIKEEICPADVDGKAVSAYMKPYLREKN